MNALETRAAALAAFRDGDSGNTALEACVRAGVYGMAGFVRVAPAPALAAGGGLAFAESARDQAELKIPNVALTPGRIPRQRHHPRLQSQHSVTTGATPPSTSRTTTSPRATRGDARGRVPNRIPHRFACCRDGRPASGTRHPPLVRSDTLGSSMASALVPVP